MTGIEQVLVIQVGILMGAAVMQFWQVRNTKGALLTLAGQFDQLQGIMHGYVNDLRDQFEKQLEEIKAEHQK
jgi:hypothetical protein